jgi:UDP-glucose 4-epimerase
MAEPSYLGGGVSHLITGGCGFIGRHVALILARHGHQVTIADRNIPKFEFPTNVRQNVRWKRFDMAEANWDSLTAGIDVIHHYAWSTIPATANAAPVTDLSTNVASTLALLEALRRCSNPPRLVFASSGGTVYGKVREIPVSEDHALAPITAYGVAKATVELYLGHYRALYGLDCRVARLANPFGAGQDPARGQGAATTFLHRALSGETIVIWGDGSVVRDYIHIADAASAMVALVCAPPSDGPWVFNIGSGYGISLNQIVEELQARFGRRLRVRRECGRPFDVPINVLDITRARLTLNWSPQLSFSDGISRTLVDLEKNADLSTLSLNNTEPRESRVARAEGNRPRWREAG